MKLMHIMMAIFVPFIWGTGFVVAKGAITEFPPILLMAFRFLVTSLVLVWFVKPPIGSLRALFLIAIVASAIHGNKSQAARTKALSDFKILGQRTDSIIGTDLNYAYYYSDRMSTGKTWYKRYKASDINLAPYFNSNITRT